MAELDGYRVGIRVVDFDVGPVDTDILGKYVGIIVILVECLALGIIVDDVETIVGDKFDGLQKEGRIVQILEGVLVRVDAGVKLGNCVGDILFCGGIVIGMIEDKRDGTEEESVFDLSPLDG